MKDRVCIAVTGASGFVGQHVLANLIGQEVDVIAVTRDATRLREWADRVRVIEMDIARFTARDVARIGHSDVVIHLAWDGLPNYASLHHIETELPKQFCFLKALVDAGLPSLLATGTCFEYGRQSGSLSEDQPTSPATPYGHAKDALRRQMEFLKDLKPFKLTWARLFYLYGEGQQKHSIYRQLNDAASRGENTFKMSGGEQLRDYLPAADAGRILVKIARSMERAPDVVNVCSGRPISMRRLVEQWIQDHGWRMVPETGHYPYPDYEPMAFWGDRTRLDRFLSIT